MTHEEKMADHDRRAKEYWAEEERNPSPDMLTSLCDGTFYPRQAQAQIDMGHKEVCLVCPGWEISAKVKMFPGTVLVDGQPGSDKRARTFPKG